MTGRVRVSVVYALPDRQHRYPLELDAAATVADALAAIAPMEPFHGLDLDKATVGIFGDTVARDRQLREGDRIEIYRPLRVDPRDARRQRVERERRMPRGRGRAR